MVELGEGGQELRRYGGVASGTLAVPGSSGPGGSTAWACVVYSLVPFLGILFVPVSVAFVFKDMIFGGEQIRRRALNPLAASLAVLTVQIVLWWLLYAVPGMQV